MVDILKPRGIYFDNAATSLMPKEVFNVLQKYYAEKRSNVGRGMHKLGMEATFALEDVREKLIDFFNAKNFYVIFTFNSTFASNLVAWSYTGKLETIAFSILEHNSSYLPWLKKAKTKNAKINYLELDDDWNLILEGYYDVAIITHVSNVIGKINNIKRIADLMVVDGAQIVGHEKVDLDNSDIDVFYFSAHKCLGPYGAGALFIKKDKFSLFDTLYLGGGAVKEVSRSSYILKNPPFSWEPGTPSVAEIIAMGKALELIQKNFYQIKRKEKDLTKHMLDVMQELNAEYYGGFNKKLPIFAFNLPNIRYSKVAEVLNQHDVYVRAGHHCAHLLMNYLGIEGCVRASLHFYNTHEEIEYFKEILKKVNV